MKKSKVLLGFLLAVAIVAVVALASGHQSQAANENIPGQYIVVLKDSVKDSGVVGRQMAQSHGLSILQEYTHALKGFAAFVPEGRLQALENDPRVEFISEDRIVHVAGKPGPTPPPTQPAQVIPTGVRRIGVSTSTTAKGTGITVAVIDTGIDFTHPDLAANILPVNKTCVKTANAQDDQGHGTHVAGIIAALDNSIGVVGVAPQAKLIAVKVINGNGSGTTAQMICGIDWVTANALTYNIKLANMSLSAIGTSDNNCGNTNRDAMHKAICASIAKGVTYVVSAANDSIDASQRVPAAYDDAVITVSALADFDGLPGALLAYKYPADDTFASFSNYGPVVDIGAPGVSILSTWLGGGYATLDGTSMASPHVVGAAALYLQTHVGATWTQVRDYLRSTGEALGAGHTDPSGLHPEPVLSVANL